MNIYKIYLINDLDNFLEVKHFNLIVKHKSNFFDINKKDVINVVYYLLLTASMKTSNSSRIRKGGLIAFHRARISDTLE